MSIIGKVFKYYWRFIKPNKVAYFSVFLTLLLRISFGTLLVGYIYKVLIDTLGNEIFSVDERYQLGLVILLPLSLSYLLAISMGRYAEWLVFRFLSKSIKNMYEFCFEKINLHSHGFFNNNFSGALVTKTKRFVHAFDQTNGILMFNFWPTIVVVTGSVVALSFESKKLAYYFLAWCLAYTLIILFFIKQKLKIDLARAEADSKITGALADSITNVSNIKAFSAFRSEASRFEQFTSLLKERMSQAWRFTMSRHAFQALTMFIFEVVVVYLALRDWQSGEITLGVFVMAYAYLHTITGRIWDLSSGLTNFMEGVTNAKEMIDILETEIEVKDPEHPEVSRIKEGTIEFKNVAFKYKDGAEVLENFNFKIRAGEKVGLVGHSGSGKSTLTKLILRFVDPDEGEVLIDGQNIAKITQSDLRKSIAYVPQESILFHRTIKENIGYAKEDATFEEIVEASKLAHAHEFIEKMKEGYDTMVGERGVKLSGGERQRVSISRAMLKHSPILILDEATSSLDSVSESYIQESFGSLMQGKTTIVIAHRLSTIQKMDRIIVLDEGAVVEEGTHQELLQKNGFYASLWNHQTGSFLD